MRYIKLGKTDIEVSVVGLGTWAIGGWMWGGTNESESIKAINTAIDMGINLIDTAPAYGMGLSEEIVGKAIKGKRDKFVIATKCGLVWDFEEGELFFIYESGEKVFRFLGPKSIRYEIEKSLSRLGIDYIDLYQTHWQDSTTPIEDTMETLMDLKKEGKIRSIGASNASLEQLKKYNQAGQLDADQEEYNLIDNRVEQENLTWCKNNKVTVLSYGSLAKGLLTGRIAPDREFIGDDLRKDDFRFKADNIKKVNSVLKEEFKPIADKYGLSIAQISIATLVSQGGVVALCGARNKRQAEENAKAGDSVIEESDVKKVRKVVESLNL
jgi:methylglyoxal reductase